MRAAVDLALRDANVGARMDRAWMIAVLKEQIDRARLSGAHRRAAVIPRLLRLRAELYGVLPPRHAEVEANGAHQRSDVRILIHQIILAIALVSIAVGTPLQ